MTGPLWDLPRNDKQWQAWVAGPHDLAAREAELRALTEQRLTRGKILDDFRLSCAGHIPRVSQAGVLAELRAIAELDARIDALFGLIFGD